MGKEIPCGLGRLDPAPAALRDDLAEEVAPAQVGVRLPELRAPQREADVRVAVEHQGLDARPRHGADEARGVEARQEVGIQSGI